jgi:hypothetical protein
MLANSSTESVHEHYMDITTRKRGKALLPALIELLVT